MKQLSSSCEVPTDAQPVVFRGGSGSQVLRYAGGGWDTVPVDEYKADPRLFRGVSRRLLAAPDAAAFEVRYFEVEPGGYTTHEQHEHVHVVACVRGRGRVRLGDDVHGVDAGDIVHVAPREPHQFSNPYSEPFGFLCIVDQDRDRPVPVDTDAMEEDHAASR